MTTGRSLNCSSRSLHNRIEELPTNSTPPAGRGCAASSAANALNAASHGDEATAVSVDATAGVSTDATAIDAVNNDANAATTSGLTDIKIRARKRGARLVNGFCE